MVQSLVRVVVLRCRACFGVDFWRLFGGANVGAGRGAPSQGLAQIRIL